MRISDNSGEVCVENCAIVRSVYGYWPSFHDAEVVEFGFKMRKEDRNLTDATIKILHAGQDNPHWTGPGPKCVIEFECKDISNPIIDITELYAGNWISRLIIFRKRDGVCEFNLEASAGLEAKFDCKSVSIAAIYPIA